MYYFLSINRVKLRADLNRLYIVVPQHIEWVKRKIKEGSILQAGKWGKDGGMSIIASATLEQAIEILEQDPLVLQDLVGYEINNFYPCATL